MAPPTLQEIDLPGMGLGSLLDTKAFLGGMPNVYLGEATFHYFQPQFNTAFISAEGLFPAINAIHEEMAQIRSSLEHHQELLQEILNAVRGDGIEIELEDVSNEDARRRIMALFKDLTGSLFYDDIAERLKLPLRQTVEICNQLEVEGLIGEPSTKQ